MAKETVTKKEWATEAQIDEFVDSAVKKALVALDKFEGFDQESG